MEDDKSELIIKCLTLKQEFVRVEAYESVQQLIPWFLGKSSSVFWWTLACVYIKTSPANKTVFSTACVPRERICLSRFKGNDRFRCNLDPISPLSSLSLVFERQIHFIDSTWAFPASFNKLKQPHWPYFHEPLVLFIMSTQVLAFILQGWWQNRTGQTQWKMEMGEEEEGRKGRSRESADLKVWCWDSSHFIISQVFVNEN